MSLRVIGKLEDTANYVNKAGYEMVEPENWSLLKNYKWIQEGIDSGAPFKVVSPTTAENMIKTGGANPGPTAFAREIWQLKGAGYKPIYPGSNIWVPGK